MAMTDPPNRRCQINPCREKCGLADGLLKTDMSLIALNETHAVFAIRVARATLAENHFFPNVVSDVAGGDGRLQLPPRPGSSTEKQQAQGRCGMVGELD